VNGHLALQLVNFKKSGARASVFQSAVSQTPQYNPRGPMMVLPIKGARGYRQLLMVATMNDEGPATRRGKLGLAFPGSSGALGVASELRSELITQNGCLYHVLPYVTCQLSPSRPKRLNPNTRE
jgi:hypothetical protein